MSRKKPLISFTFDDGTLDHYTHAAPILEKYGYRGIFCITTGYIDGFPKWTYPCMQERMVKKLLESGHEIASHSATHPNMRSLWFKSGKKACISDLKKSYDAIFRMTGKYPKWFCYPYNRGCPMVSRLARQIGMEPFNPIGRPNLGGCDWPQSESDQLKKLSNIIFSGKKKVDLMFHGCLPGEGWNSFFSPTDFEFIVKSIKKFEDDGLLKVVKYSQSHGVKQHGVIFNLIDISACLFWQFAYRVMCIVKRRALAV